jgi:hypothetical protein
MVSAISDAMEETLPASERNRAAEAGHGLVRLDTSRLVHLYPPLSPGGALISDDYGFWQEAVELRTSTSSRRKSALR